MTARFPAPSILKSLHVRGLAKYAFELFVIGALYFALTKLDLTLASIHSSTIPIAAAPGLALAAVLLRGLRIWPAIFAAALLAHVPTDMVDLNFTDSILALAIAAGDTLEAVIGGYLINLWSDGCRTFETPARAAKFVTVSLGPSAMLGATVGVGAICLIESASADFIAVWVTRWLRDASGMLVVAPAIVLWAVDDVRAFDHDRISFGKKWTLWTAFFAAAVLGFVAFSPLLELPVNRSA